jgi:nuclear pore complex protein Nup62
LNKDLGDVIDEINGVSAMLSNTTGPDDPVGSRLYLGLHLLIALQLSHVVRVLNSHLQQLQRIDMDASTLQVKVQEAQKQARGVGQNDWRIGTDHAEHYYKTFMQGR